MFDPKNFTATPAHKEVFGLYERVYTVIDLVAALAFVVGSILFFWSSTAIPATWLFLIGSLCFAAKPCGFCAKTIWRGCPCQRTTPSLKAFRF